jgi:L-ascorbate metabolism protein UlaG (beta-lactamase superfamily)
MYIKKLGHCCLVIKENNLTILTDPGMYTTEQNEVTGINVILITHEHQDHLHIDSLKKVLIHNPDAKIITNKSVGILLNKENIAHTIIGDGQKVDINSVLIEGMGTQHAVIYKERGQVENTGYFINKKLFYPGDAFYKPERSVEILAIPVAGPWVKISDAIEYGLAVKPKHAFPVHDGGLKDMGINFTFSHPQKVLTDAGIVFHSLKAGDEIEL